MITMKAGFTMYGLPSDFDSHVFIGRTLAQVCVTTNTVEFHFDPLALIHVVSDFATEKKGSMAIWHQIPLTDGTVLPLLGLEVTSAASSLSGDLRLTFENGASIYLHDETKMYESYQIHVDGRIIIV